MLITMMVLLMSTAVASFAIHAATTDIKATGNTVRASETQQVAETALNSALALIDQLGPQTILSAMDRSDPVPMAPYEPTLAPGKRAYRIQGSDFNTVAGIAGKPLDARVTSGQNALRAFQPQFMVDITDDHVYTGTIAGERSDGHSRFTFLYATYTARGRTEIPTDVSANGDYRVSGDPRGFNESASDARAYGISGPFPK